MGICSTNYVNTITNDENVNESENRLMKSIAKWEYRLKESAKLVTKREKKLIVRV